MATIWLLPAWVKLITGTHLITAWWILHTHVNRIDWEVQWEVQSSLLDNLTSLQRWDRVIASPFFLLACRLLWDGLFFADHVQVRSCLWLHWRRLGLIHLLFHVTFCLIHAIAPWAHRELCGALLIIVVIVSACVSTDNNKVVAVHCSSTCWD